MIDHTIVARLLLTTPRTVERLRARTLLARQSQRPTITLTTEELEALTTDLEQMCQALGEYRQRLRTLAGREVRPHAG